MLIFLKPIYIFVLALVLAILEVQIEGAYGWAEKLPTWRPRNNNKWLKVYKKIMKGKDMTGYHLAMFSFVLLIFHFPFFAGTQWNLTKELETIAVFFFFIIIWDFLWFVVNPYFSLRNFHRHHNFWHHQWLWKMPTDYYISFLISFVFALIAHLRAFYLIEWLIMVIIILTLTFLTWTIIKIIKPEWE